MRFFWPSFGEPPAVRKRVCRPSNESPPQKPRVLSGARNLMVRRPQFTTMPAGLPGGGACSRRRSAPGRTDKAARLGAALAYYSVFSIGPLMLIAIAIAGLIFGQDAVRGEVSAQLKGLLGNAGAEAIEGMLAGARRPMEGLWSALSRCSWLQPAW